jgi:hypothetical protein
MMAAPHYTMDSTSPHAVMPERLQAIGKRASAMFINEQIPLTDAVIRSLQGESGLGREHVQRVTEFANNYAFEAMFAKTGSDHKVVDFGEAGPADPSTVLKELGATGAVMGHQKLAAVMKPVNRERFVPGQDGIMEMFHGVQKLAAAAPVENSLSEIYELREDVGRAKDELILKTAASSQGYLSAANELYRVVKTAVLEGTSPAEIATVFKFQAEDLNFVKLALKEIAQRMEGDNVPAVPMRKIASSEIPNVEHPVCKAFDHFVKVAMSHFTTVCAAEDLSEKYQALTRLLKEKLL